MRIEGISEAMITPVGLRIGICRSAQQRKAERKSHTRSATFHLTKGIARELLGKAAYTKTRGLNPIRYAELVREYLHDHPSISNREVRELLGLGESATAQVEASRYLKKWSGSSGFLIADGNGAKRCYRLKKMS